MKFNVTIDRDEDDVWIIECPSIPGCISQGATKEEALENIQDAISACLQVRSEMGLPLTIETKQVEVLVMNLTVLQINLMRAGELFMHSMWIQSQMVDLLILKKHPAIHSEFIDNPVTIPNVLFLNRAEYWKKDFNHIRKELIAEFTVDPKHKEDLEALYHLRNAIAHCHVSMGRDYFLYRPKGDSKEQSMIAALKLERKTNEANPSILKLAFDNDDHYYERFSHIQRLDAECFSALAQSISIPHSRIR
jgi:predicted RNase H-like HicB family nuclease